MIQNSYHRPFIPMLLAFMAGIVLGQGMPGGLVYAGIPAAGCAVLILCRIIQGRSAGILPLLLLVCMGYVSIQSWTAPRFPENHIIHYAGPHPTDISGCVYRVNYQNEDRTSLILRTQFIGSPPVPVQGLIQMTASGGLPELLPGDQITFSGSIRRIRNFNNPGGYDYERHMAFKNLWVSAYALKNKPILVTRPEEQGFWRGIERFRSRIRRIIEQTGTAPASGILAALVIGDRAGIPQELQEAFNRAGISHLLAISGLHIGIIASIFLVIFRFLLSHFSAVLWSGGLRKYSAFLSFFPIMAYGLISGMSPSTQRAVLMVTVFLTGFWFEKEQNSMNTLAIAAMSILIVHPPAVFAISFQLSFMAVLSILYGMSSIPETQGGPVKRSFIAFGLVSCFAILGTAPLTLIHFNQVSLAGVAANLIFIPLIGFLIVPLGLVSAFAFGAGIPLAEMGLGLASGMLSWFLEWVPLFANLPFNMKTVTPNLLETICYYVILWAGFQLIAPNTDRTSSENKPQHGSRLPFTSGQIRMVLLTSILILCADALYWTQIRLRHEDLRVTVIDVGQGTSSLLELPGGFNLLIDGGGFYDNAVFDVGERVVAPFLWHKKIQTIEMVILSHPDADHMNGLLFITEHFNVKTILTNGVEKQTSTYKELMKIIRGKGIQHLAFPHIPRRFQINGVDVEILYPIDTNIAGNGKDAWRMDDNNQSLAARVEYGPVSFLFPGDLETQAEQELVEHMGDRLKTTVLIAPHHGCGTSNSEIFLDYVNPSWVVISAGWQNRFKCPSPSVLNRYKQRGCRVLRTDMNGAVEMTVDKTYGNLMDSLTTKYFLE
jgi:competence protein ComEC